MDQEPSEDLDEPIPEPPVKTISTDEAGKTEEAQISEETEVCEEKKYFACSSCNLREEYEYFGREPPYTKRYKFNEDCYVIEDPFQPPRQGDFIILGAHCQDCNKAICRDASCSFYYNGTFCIPCARCKKYTFPVLVQEKLSKVVL